MNILIRPLQEQDLPEATRIYREAFATYLKTPEKMLGVADLVGHRFKADPSRCFVAELEGQLVGSNFSTHWGSMAFFGPTTTRQKGWTGNSAKLLIQATLDLAAERGTTFYGGYTHANSPQHARFFQEFGFWPRFLVVTFGAHIKPAAVKPWSPDWRQLSTLSEAERATALGQCRELTEALYPGLDLTDELTATLRLGFGDGVLVYRDSRLSGFALGYAGNGSEAPARTLALRFGAVHPGGKDPAADYQQLLDACEGLTARLGHPSLTLPVNTSRFEAFRALYARGYVPMQQGISMHRDNLVATGRADLFVLDDWR